MTEQAIVFSGSKFQRKTSVEAEGVRWDIGVCTYEPVPGESVKYTAAVPQNGNASVALWTNLVDGDRMLEKKTLFRQTGSEWDAGKLDPSQVHPDVLKALQDVTNQEKAFGYADFRRETLDTDISRDRCSIETGGDTWMIHPITKNGFPVTVAVPLSDTKRHVTLVPTITRDGEIADYSLLSDSPEKPSYILPKSALDARLQTEMVRHANHFKLFGKLQEKPADLFAGQMFTPVTSMLDGENRRWDLGMLIENPQKKPEEAGVHYAAALLEHRRYGIARETELVSPEGRIEAGTFVTVQPNGYKAPVSADSRGMPLDVLKELDRVTDENMGFGRADYRAILPKEITTKSFTVRDDGKLWDIQATTLRDSQALYVQATSRDKKTAFGAIAKTLNEDGQTAEFGIQATFGESSDPEKKAWHEVTDKDHVPARLVREMEAFGNHFKVFGKLQERYEQGMNSAVEAATEYLDAGYARLMRDHHRSEGNSEMAQVESEAARIYSLGERNPERTSFQDRLALNVMLNGYKGRSGL